MINRLSLPDGVPLPQENGSLEHAVGELIIARLPDIVTMEPGVYDVTPKIWTKHNHNHEVTVLDNGEGIYRITPRYLDAGYIMPTEPQSDFRPGGRVQPINADHPLAVLAGGNPRKPDLQLFELFLFARQPEPVSEPEMTARSPRGLFSWLKILQRV